MWSDGYCFAAGMGAVLVLLPVLGIWSSMAGKRSLGKIKNGKKKCMGTGKMKQGNK